MSAAPKPKAPTSTGFALVERILHEYRDRNRSPLLENLQARVTTALAQAAALPAAPAIGKEPQLIKGAMGAAIELIETMRAEARRNRT